MTDYRCPDWVIGLADMDGGTKVTLMTLWSFATWSTEAPGVVWPTVGTIAARSGDSERTVQHRLAKLRKAGWIRRTMHMGHEAFELAWRNPLLPDTQPIAPATGCTPAGNGLRGWVQPVSVEGCNPLHPELSESSQDRSQNEQTESAHARNPQDQTDAQDPVGPASSPTAVSGPVPSATLSPAAIRRHIELQEREANLRQSTLERQRVRESRPAVPEPPVDQRHWLAIIAAPFAQFGQIAAMDAAWREKTTKTAKSLAWTEANVASMMAGYQRDFDDLSAAGTLAVEIAAGRFPEARHMFSRSIRRSDEPRRPWHGPDGSDWASASFKRWCVEAAATPKRPDQFREQAELRRRRAAQREADIAAIEAKGDVL